MKQRRTARRRSAAQWADLLASWDRTAMTAAQFARHLGVAPGTLAWWRWRIERRDDSLARTDHKPRLVEVDLLRDDPHDASWVYTSPNGHALRVSGAIDLRTLHALLDHIAARRAP